MFLQYQSFFTRFLNKFKTKICKQKQQCMAYLCAQGGLEQEGGREQGAQGEAGVWGHDSPGQASCLGARTDHPQAHQGCSATGAHR